MSDKEENIVIYKATLPNGKAYVGQSVNFSARRARHNTKTYKGCPYFNNAVRKYGKENVVWEILDTAKSKKEAGDLERFYIKKFDTRNHDKGYNIALGGEAPMLGRKHTEAHKQYMRELMLGEKNHRYGVAMSDETKAKLREKNSGENSWWYGKKHKPETIEKCRETKLGEKNPNYGDKVSFELRSARGKKGYANMSEESLARVREGQSKGGKAQTWQHLSNMGKKGAIALHSKTKEEMAVIRAKISRAHIEFNKKQRALLKQKRQMADCLL